MSYVHGKSIIKIAIADDHEMFRELVSTYIDTIENCKVVIQAANGKELIEKIEIKPNTDLVLLDISMPVMNGYVTASFLREKFPEIKILFCSIYNNELAICRMIGSGGNGFVHKGASAAELKRAFFEVMKDGYSFPLSSSKLLFAYKSIDSKKHSNTKMHFSPKELKFLQLVCTEKTYKEIAADLELNPRQVDYLREMLFARFDVHSRIGLAFNARHSGILTEDTA